ncbi:MAG: hypothetical protein LBJ21_07175 [Acidobacteriota bacterium]|jgi:hypothetical protein|nr:hypothetical protein [Acidobacteriota bacterium]
MNIRTNKKYLLLIPLVVSLIMLTFFSAAFEQIVNEKHEQKYNTVKRSLNFIVSVVDHIVEADGNWETYDYSTILTGVFQGIDETSAVHVVLLNHDLTPISGSFVNELDETFDLLSHDAFVTAVTESDDQGELTITISDGNDQPYEMLVYFKKIPTGVYDNKLIAVYGVSKYAIDDNFAPWLVWGIVGLVAMTVLLQIWMILYISKLSDTERLAQKNNEKAGDPNASERSA